MTYDRQAQIREVHQRRRDVTDKKANDAIDALLREKQPVNFNRVHELSGISIATLYKHERVRKRIEYLRDEARGLPSVRDRKTQTSDEGKDAIIASLKRKIKKLEEENRALKEANRQRLSDEWKGL